MNNLTLTLNNTVNEAITKYIKDKQKTLYQFEKNKLYNFLGRDLVELLKKHKCFVAGGAITSLFTGNETNDVDIYFRNENSCIKFAEEAWKDEYRVNILTRKSVLMKFDEVPAQLIHFKYFDNAQEIFDTFDFTVCMGAFDFENEQFILHDEFLRHNSQRILKFNKNTAFPIVSLLRVQKYNKKSYSISKPEFLRIVMRCMDLDIKNVDELKDQLGGMYGINYDKIINLDQDEDFSLDKVIDKIENLNLHEDYFKEPEEVKFSDLNDIIDQIKKNKMKIIYIKNKCYKISYDDTLKQLENKPTYFDEVSTKEYFEQKKFYKYVKKDGENTYRSFYDNTFTYAIGEESVARGNSLFFNEKSEIECSPYRNQINRVLIEVKVNHEDFYCKNGKDIQAKKCQVVREVPVEEYKSWVDNEVDDLW